MSRNKMKGQPPVLPGFEEKEEQSEPKSEKKVETSSKKSDPDSDWNRMNVEEIAARHKVSPTTARGILRSALEGLLGDDE